ncbi:Hpt domain-containing protein [Robertkochia marina]|uniref:Hpt domain-containing protein n=1 Tax=Robertkochia marina TaxID=1227945 RepID=A0A4S3LZQ2_9FLAO|nr:Hpt domain-containing protein [Robertkochia marina]THD67602.1 Hpt domain-containing protein [Robertkochia marina]TRZ44529.1 Hpt domain-containing protein [Robertkochia marina]
MKDHPNLSYIHQLSGGDKVFEYKIFEVIKKELPQELLAFKHCIEKNNFKEASSVVHKLKHKISILGMEQNYALAEIYEKELKEGINNGQQEFEEILQGMLTFIEQT